MIRNATVSDGERRACRLTVRPDNGGYDEYVSDPSNPVPYTQKILRTEVIRAIL